MARLLSVFLAALVASAVHVSAAPSGLAAAVAADDGAAIAAALAADPSLLNAREERKRRTALMSAALMGKAAAAAALLDAGADYSIPEQDGYTPLHVRCVRRACVRCVHVYSGALRSCQQNSERVRSSLF